jgi:ferredoxin
MARRTSIYVPIIKNSFHRRFQMARMTRRGRMGDIVGKVLFEGDDMVILPRDGSVRKKVLSVDIRAEPQNIVLPSSVVEHFVRLSPNRFIMNSCICRSADGCEDYPIGLGCLFLGIGVTRIDPRLGKMASEEEALAHLKRCREAGLVHLIGRNKLDSMWLGTGRKEELMTICNCCPCCCLWKMLPDLSPELGSSVTRMPGVEVIVDVQACIGCGVCTQGRCFLGAISLADGKAVIDKSLCRGCGRCAEGCPRKAISVTVSDGSMDEAIARIAPLVPF